MAFSYSNATNNSYNKWKDASSNYMKIATAYQNTDFNNTKYDALNGQSVNDLLQQVLNYADFSYDMNKDQLFQMYKQQYSTAGQSAMKNTLAQNSAVHNGGYATSSSQSAGQNTWQQYMDELSNKAVDTYQSAYDQYNQNYQRKLNNYNSGMDYMKSAQENLLNKVNTAHDLASDYRSQYEYNKNFDWGKYNDNRTYKVNKDKLEG